ncbi:hypothetical protein CN918_26300 [Priestia megaterium]|nr:hypothetical protein CN918_26300 [Priestia megaterium]
MNELWTIYSFHVKELVRKKGFLYSSLFIVALILIVSYFSYQSSSNAKNDKVYVSMLMKDAQLSEKQMDKAFKKSGYDIVFTNKNEKSLKQAVKKKEMLSAFVLKGKLDDPSISHYYRQSPTQDVSLYIEKALESQVVSSTLSEANVDPLLLQHVDSTYQVKNNQLSETDKSYGLVYPMIFLLYVFIIGFGQAIAMSVVSEKSTKVVEILLPKINAANSFYAKIAAALTTGLIQLAVTVVSFIIVRQLGWIDSGKISFMGMDINYSDISPLILLTFLLSFIGGFVLYGLLYASLGAKVSRIEDLGPVLTPIVFLLMGAFGLGIFTIISPESTVSEIASYIPFFSPTVLFARIILNVASPFEITISTLIFVITLIVLTVLCKKWFLQSISHYGSPKKRKWNFTKGKTDSV